MDTVTLIYGLIFFGMGALLFYFGYIYWKKSQNTKMCRGAYACLFRGPDKNWVRLLPARNGLIQKPAGKYLLKKERKFNIPWPEAGYVIPKDLPILPIMWPLTGSDQVKCPVGLLVYDIGDPMPIQKRGDKYVIDPDTIDNIHDADVARQLFVDIPNELNKDAKVKGKLTDLLPYVIVIGIAGILILQFIIMGNQSTTVNDLNQIKGGLGY
jgi:hypothetical protein